MLIIIFSEQNSVPFTATRGRDLGSGNKGKKKIKKIKNYITVIATSINYIKSFSPLVIATNNKYLCF